MKSRKIDLRSEPGVLAIYDFDPGNVTVVSNAISELVDCVNPSVSAHTAVQGTAGYRPVYTASDSDFNGHGSGTFNVHSSCMLSTGTWATALPAVCSWFMVFKLPATFNTYNIVADGDVNLRQNMTIQQSSGTRLVMHDNIDLISVGTYSANQIVVVCAEFNSSVSKLYVNDFTNAAASGNTGTQRPTLVNLGNYIQGGYPCNGKIAYVAIINGALDAWAIDRYGKTLGEKYGVAVT